MLSRDDLAAASTEAGQRQVSGEFMRDGLVEVA